MSNQDYKSLYEQLQKETNDKLRKQDHTISKLEKKIEKMQQQNHAQMQTLDLRMQQMMGMFQMFMMNQTIGMQQQPQGQIPPQATPQYNTSHSNPSNQSQSKPPTPSHPLQNHPSDSGVLPMSNTAIAPQLGQPTGPSELRQSQSVMNIGHAINSYNTRMLKSRSYHNNEDHLHLQPNFASSAVSSDEDSENPLSDPEEVFGSANRSHSKSRKKYKRDKRDKERERKERKREKKEKKKKEKKRKKEEKEKRERERERENKKRNNTESIPIFDDKDMDINVPPPPSYPFHDQTRARAATTNPTSNTSSVLTTGGRLSASGRPVPPPPPKESDSKPSILRSVDGGAASPKPPPPARDGSRSRRHHKSKKHRNRDHSKPRKKDRDKHSKSQSEDVGVLADKQRVKVHKSRRKRKQKGAESVDVVSFVEIDTKYGNNSPTMSDSRTLLDHLNTLELDVDTPSDEESLIYVREDDLKDDPDIEVSYDWAARKPKKKAMRKHRHSESEESADDDISILSLSKQPGHGIIDEEDLSDSGYSDDEEDNGDSLHSSEDNEEEIDTEDDRSSSPEDEPDPATLSKAERKRRKKEKKRRKKEKKRRKKEKKEKKRREREAKKKSKKHKDKKNSQSMGEGKDHSHNSGNVSLDVSKTSRSNSRAKLDEDGEGGSNAKEPNGRHSANVSDNDTGAGSKKKSTITGKIKKIGQKLKKMKDKDGDKIDQDNDRIMIEDERGSQFKIRPNPLNKTATIKFKDMFKGKAKKNVPIAIMHQKDDSHVSVDYSKVLGKEEELFAGRTDRSQTTITHVENERKKKKKKLGLRGFKARSFNAAGNDAMDDDLVDYGERRTSQKKKLSKPRRGSDSNISAMSSFHEPSWFDSALNRSPNMSFKESPNMSYIKESPNMSATNSKKSRRKKKGGRHKPYISLEAESLLQPDLDGDVTPPPSPLDKGLRFDQMYNAGRIPEDSEDDDDYRIDSNSDRESEIDLDEQRATKLNDDTSGDGSGRFKKTSSIDDYAKSRGSKSTSKDIMISEDLDEMDDFGVKRARDNDYDPDIDVGDYDWNSYVSLKTTKAITHSDEDTTDTASKLIISPRENEPRPQSARVGGKRGNQHQKQPNPQSFFPTNMTKQFSNNSSSTPRKRKKTADDDKDRDRKLKRKGTTDSDHGSSKGHKASGKKKKSKSQRKNTGDKDKKKKPEKPSAIKTISEDKKLSVKGEKKKSSKVRTASPKSPHTPTTFGGKKKRKGTAEYDKDGKKKGKHKTRKSELPKKDGKKKINKKPNEKTTSSKNKSQTKSSSPYLEPLDDDSKEPEVLIRARGQSMHHTLAPTSSNDTKGIEIDYIFANKKLKSNVPKMNYDKYENLTQRPDFRLELEHIIGFMGYDNLCRNNLYSLKDEERNIIVYNVGCMAIIHDVDTNEQTIYRDHKCPITSITVHPKIDYIATASIRSPLSSKTSAIRVWNPNTLDSLPEIMCAEMIGEVRHLNFSPVSTLLFLTCGENQKNTQLIAFKLEQRSKPVINVQFKTISNKSVQIYGMAFNPSPDRNKYIDQFVVFGSNILYWCQTTYANKEPIPLQSIDEDSLRFRYCKINKLQPKGSTDGKKEKAYHCGLFLEPGNENNIGYYILGGQSGTIYLGYRNTIICSLPGHNGRVQSIKQFTENQFITVGFDGTWKVWNIDYDSQIIQDISGKVTEKEMNDETKDNDDEDEDEDNYEFEEKRSISDNSASVIKAGAIKILCEDTFVPSNDNISKSPHSCFYDQEKEILYLGTSCNSIISVSNINVKNGDNDLQIISSGHMQGIVGVAISPKLDSLIATLSEEGLLRLWNISNHFNKSTKAKSTKSSSKNNAKRLDNCVALQSLISQKQQSKLKATVIAWSPDGKFIATGYNVSKVSLCTAHPLKKVQEIDLSQYKNRGKQIKSNQAISALCFSYDKNVLAVAHLNQLSLFNVEKSNKKCTKWDLTLSMKDTIKHIYFSEDDDLLGIITEKYDTKFYSVSMKKKSLIEASRPPKADVVWWPRIPLTSYVLKGLYQKDTMKWKSSELVDADIYESLKIVASADEYGVIRLHELPALNETAHNSYKHHYGPISKILFIPDQERLISVGLHDRSIIRWNIEEIETML